MDAHSLTEIADRARILYTAYPQASAEYARDKRNLEDWQNLESLGRVKGHEKDYGRDLLEHYKESAASCARWAQWVAELALIVAQRLPSLWPQLRLVQVGARWHEGQGVDWDAAVAELRAIEAAALQAEGTRKPAAGTRKRARSTKQDVVLKTHAAITYKAEHPTATEEECAKAANIPRTTLGQQSDWNEWVPKIEKAAASGNLTRLRTALDKRTGELVAFEPDDDPQTGERRKPLT